jgi:hypothetical protein
MPGIVMQGRPEGSGSFGSGLLHSRPLPMMRMNQRPQAFPTLLHCPDSGQNHNPARPSHRQSEATGATAETKLPPTRAAPECGQPEQPHTPRKHASVTVRNPHGHLSPQHHKGMGLRNSVGMHQPPSRIDGQAPEDLLVPILPWDAPQPAKAVDEGGDSRVHLLPGGCTVS